MKDEAPASVTENIDKIVRSEEDAIRRRTHGEAFAEAIGSFVGTLPFILLHLLAFVGWVVVNAGTIPGVTVFDPFPYPLLSSVASLEAVMLAAFVLMKQNRMSTIADRRDHLDLQVNLLTEREATQIIQMLDRLSVHFGIEQHYDADSRELGQHVAIEHLVDELHRRLPHVPGG